MCFCKKKSGMTMGKLILWMLAALGVAAAAFAAIKLVKKHLCRCGKGKKGQNGCLSDLDFCLDDEDVKALADFGKLKAKFFSQPVTNGLCNVAVMSEDVVKNGETCGEWLLYEGDKGDLDEGNELAHGTHIGIKRIRTLERPLRAEKLHGYVYNSGQEEWPVKFYYVEPDFLKAVLSATTESGETDTAKWMTAGKQGATDEAHEGVAQKIAATKKVLRSDTWYGYNRTVFDFEGHEAWIVSPKCDPAAGLPWTWTMQWAEAYVDRTGVLDLLAKGWHHVTIETFQHRMDEEGLRVSRAFQKFLVEEIGFAPKACLVGMSWGGFFSTRYAAAFPECVGKIYLDAPLMNFDGFAKVGGTPTENAAQIGPWANMPPADGNWSTDPRMPVNMADQIAKAGIPILLLYGGQDATVPPSRNCELFAERFKAAGGKIDVRRRALYGHHPHGEDPDKTSSIVSFFEGRQSSTTNF